MKRSPLLALLLVSISCTPLWAQTADALRLRTPVPRGPIAESAQRALSRALLQSVPPKPARPRDSVDNGVAIGAGIGAAAGFTLISVLYAHCDDSCEAPAFSSMAVPVTAFGAGVGALVGYLIDRAR